MRTAIVLIAHGSRREEANAELRQLAETIGRQLPDRDVVPAFLELAEPTIPAAVETCLARGAERVLLFPYFLSAGVHVTRDLEGFREQFATGHPRVEFRLTRPLGAHPEIARIVLEMLAGSEEAAQSINRETGGSRGSPTQSE